MTRTYAQPPSRYVRSSTGYALPAAGLPAQSEITRDRSIFTPAYMVLTRRTMSDIVTSRLPGWRGTRAWIIARPMTGFLETFAHMILEVAAGGGCDGSSDTDKSAEAFLFVVSGSATLDLDGETHELRAGSYVFAPPGLAWTIRNEAGEACTFHWVRKRYEAVDGVATPPAFVTHDDAVEPTAMPGTNGAWATTRFVNPDDVAHDAHVNIVTFQPGAVIPFLETHVMEHGLYVLQGKANYALNGDWVEVEAGDYMALRAFCPQACYAAGAEPFRYLLYKDVNRFPRFL